MLYFKHQVSLQIFLKVVQTINKFVRTKMRLKEGTKIELQRQICQILSDLQVCSFLRFVNFRDLKKRETDRLMDRRTDGQTLL